MKENDPTTEIKTSGNGPASDYWHIRINKQCTKRWLRRAAIVSVLAFIATIIMIPTYDTGYPIRNRVMEGLMMAGELRQMISDIATKDDLITVAEAWNDASNAGSRTSRYVMDIIMSYSGVLTIYLNPATTSLPHGANTIILAPYIITEAGPVPLVTALNNSLTGDLDWFCASATNKTAIAKNAYGIPLGTLPAKHAPSMCR